MRIRSESIDQLIQSLYEFVQINGVSINSESFENISISINGSLEVLNKLQELYVKFNSIDNQQGFLEDNEGNIVQLSEIEENINTSYTNFMWKISISKINWFKLDERVVSAFFNIDNFKDWLKNIEIFNSQNAFLKYLNIQIVLPMYQEHNIIGDNFSITKKLEESLVCTKKITLPDDTKIKEFVHVISANSIVFDPQKFVFDLNEKSTEFEKILQTKYAEGLLIPIIQIFNSIDDITIKGIKHFKTRLNNESIPNAQIIQMLEKTVLWAYEENSNTRLQLLADRLSFHEHNEASLMEIVIKHIEEAFNEAKDRYKFVVTKKSEEYTKDLRDLLKDTKEKTDKYSEKTRNVINSLLRDTLGSIFFLGLTAYSRFSGNRNFIFSDDASIIFIVLGSYFLLSMVLQAMFNFWDIFLSQKEAHKWSESSMDYMTKETYDKYVTKPLSIRSKQFVVVQIVIIVIYLILSLLAFNAQKITKYIFPKNAEVIVKEHIPVKKVK